MALAQDFCTSPCSVLEHEHCSVEERGGLGLASPASGQRGGRTSSHSAHFGPIAAEGMEAWGEDGCPRA